MKSEFDVVVAGAGINGLTAACYLAKAGLEVAVVEKRNECGPFALTEDIFGAGTPTDTHAAGCFLPMSPVWKDLDLGRFGLELLWGPASGGTTWKDGKNLVFYYQPKKLVEAIGQFSQKDARTYEKLMSAVYPEHDKILGKGLFSEPSEEGLEYLWSMGKFAGFSQNDIRTMSGIELLDLLYEDEKVKLTWLCIADVGLFGDAAAKGEGAVAVLLAPLLAIAIPRTGMHSLVHSLVRCFRHHGGKLFFNAPVAEIGFEGGVAREVILASEAPYPVDRFRARQAVVMHMSPPVGLPMIGAGRLQKENPALYKKMDQWQMTGHCAFISHYLIKGLPQWKSRQWNPDIQGCPFIMRAWDSWDHAMGSLSRIAAEDTMSVLGDVGEFYNQAAVDASRISKDGLCTFSCEIEYPVTLRRHGGFGKWDDRALIDKVHHAHTDLMEELAPGFKRQLVNSTYYTPLDNWRRNPSAVYGHELGGDATGDQWYGGRMPVRGLPGLYFSNGIWPSSLTHLGNGYVAACEIAKDLGIRNQEWWTGRPMAQFLEKRRRREGDVSDYVRQHAAQAGKSA